MLRVCRKIGIYNGERAIKNARLPAKGGRTGNLAGMFDESGTSHSATCFCVYCLVAISLMIDVIAHVSAHLA
jgi:hypothetical protein